MDDMPEVSKCFGTLTPKYATPMIALFGLGSGGVGLAGIILYGLVEKALLSYVSNNKSGKVDASLKKVVLLSIGLSSLLLTIANALIFLGATTKSRGAMTAGVWVIFGMCMLLITMAIGGPVSCFFVKSACIIKKLSTSVMVIVSLILTIFLEIWLYFMIVVHSYAKHL